MFNLPSVRFGAAKLSFYPGAARREAMAAAEKTYDATITPHLEGLHDQLRVGIHPYTVSRRTPILKLAKDGDPDLLRLLRMPKPELLAFLTTPGPALDALRKKVRFDDVMALVKLPLGVLAANRKRDDKALTAHLNTWQGADELHTTVIRGDYLDHINSDTFSRLLEQRDRDAEEHNRDYAFVQRTDDPPPLKIDRRLIRTVGNTEILPPLPEDHVPDPQWQVHELVQAPDENRVDFAHRVLEQAKAVFAKPGAFTKPPLKIYKEITPASPPLTPADLARPIWPGSSSIRAGNTPFKHPSQTHCRPQPGGTVMPEPPTVNPGGIFADPLHE